MSTKSIVLAVVIYLVGLNATTTAAATVSYEPVTKEEKQRVIDCIESCGFGIETLAAMNISSSQAIQIVEYARTWYETNSSDFAAKNEAIHASRVTLSDRESKFRLGSATRESVDQARSQLRGKIADRDSALVQLKSRIRDALSGSQRQVAATIDGDARSEIAYKIVSLNDQQKSRLRDIEREFLAARASSESNEDLSLARASKNSAILSMLDADQEEVLTALRGYSSDSFGNLHEALETVLPIG